MTDKPEATKDPQAVARALLERCGETYAAEAGIRLRDTPASLYQLLVLAHLLSARIKADIAVDAARALFAHGLRDPKRMAQATWQERVDALGEGGYRRYDERTATQLGNEAEMLLERYGGDLRRMRAEGDPKELLQQFPGIGPVGVDIFLREAQAVWPEYAPYFDQRARKGAERLGLPTSPERLGRLAEDGAERGGGKAGRGRPGRTRDGEAPARLAAGLVRASFDNKAAQEVRTAVRA
ncbi:HhH-GDP family DNA glycosylase [Wenjunlia vitaminophila]|uniref:hypothetical protein n=1 Tax=Wenjunlia vitaminophila TaxID=76728 RepID=UPI00191C6B39|nr:hypothetical protein [Wenjunlia vitaminophila]